MSGHSVTIAFEPTFMLPGLSFNCNEPPEAICRAVFDCECEAYYGSGVDEQGPWHEVDDYDSDGPDPKTRHYGKPGGECGQLLFITESGCPDEMGDGEVTVPVRLQWEGDDYSWHIDPPTALSATDHLKRAQVLLIEAHAALDRAAAPDLADVVRDIEADVKARRELVEHEPSDGDGS